MNLIYRYSVHTIIAASGDHADSGLAGVRAGSRQVDSDTIVLEDVTLVPTFSKLPELGTKESVWRTRAWTMQEETFSTRKFYIGADRIYWLCQKACWTEHEALETFDVNASNPNYTEEARDGAGYTPPSLPATEYLMQEIFSRRMSYATDYLNAFSGILNDVFTRHAQEVHWGHAEIWFAQSLQWNSGYTEKQHHATH
jgi:hypothetical protein